MAAWTVPRLWEGATAFVIGGGPSVSTVDFSLIEKKHVIGVNNAFELGPFVDVCFFGDCQWIFPNWNRLRKFGGLIVTNCPREPQHEGVLRVNRSNNKGLETRPTHLAWNKSSGASAINLAVHLGAKRIVLIGFDMKVKDNQHNWHTRHKEAGFKGPGADIYATRFMRYFPQIATDAKALGIEIINANPDSALDVFPKMTLEEAVFVESRAA